MHGMEGRQSMLAGAIALLVLAGAIFYFSQNGFFSTGQVSLEEKEQELVVDNVDSETPISSPFTITGRARSTWFADGSFAVSVQDYTGEDLGGGEARAAGEADAQGYVPFEAVITFVPPQSSLLIISFEKANPGGRAADDFSHGMTVPYGP